MGSAGVLTSPSCTISGPASSFTVSGNNATLTLGLTFTSAFLGEHNITVNSYGKAANTAVIPLGVWTVSAQQTLTSTTTTLAANPATTASLGQPVVFTATVSAGGGAVSFLDGTAAIGTGTLLNGMASLTTTSLGVGTHSITAAYAGDAGDAPSSSAALAYTVTQKTSAATSTTFTASPATLLYGTGFSLKAMVTPAAATGSVSFTDNVVNNTGQLVTASPVPLTGGTAAATSTVLSVGNHTLTASYTGDGNYAGSSSSAVTVTVTPASSATRLTAMPQPVSFGSALTLAATVSSPGGTGSVTWMEGATALGKATLAQVGSTGTATLSLSTLKRRKRIM